MKLISMTDFVLQQEVKLKGVVKRDSDFNLIVNYANFLKQPLTLGMFVPCDEEGAVLDYPKWHNNYIKDLFNFYKTGGFGIPHPTSETDKKAREAKEYCKQYQQAKERVFFRGCTSSLIKDYYLVKDDNDNNLWASWNEYKTIEDLIQYNLTLTQTAIKQIGLAIDINTLN